MTDLAHTEPTDLQITEAFAAQAELKHTIRGLRAGWMRLAEQLYEFSESKKWKVLGYGSFSSWLSEPDIDIERRQAYYFIEAWRELIVERKVQPAELEGIEVTKLREVMPAIRRGHVQVDEAISDMRTLTRDDLHIRYAHTAQALAGDPAGAVNQPADAGAEPAPWRCDACGSWVRPS